MLRMALAGIALAVLAGCDGAKVRGLDGFDGFPWGSTRAEIERTRGMAPSAESNGPELVFAGWSAEGESLVGLPIESVTYVFREPCNEPVLPCDMQGGSYSIASKSQDAVGRLISVLSEKYGDFETTTYSHEPFSLDQSGAQEIIENRVWRLPDGSRVILVVASYDKAFVDYLRQEVPAGIRMISVAYQSRDQADALDRQSNLLSGDKPI